MNKPIKPLYNVISDVLVERFWQKVEKKDLDQCWEWTGSRNRDGYGKLRLLDKTTALSNRIALTVYLGRDIIPGMLACHKCDNPRCCNPQHLFEGSPSDNVKDASAKGRLRQWNGERSGEKNFNAKLTEDLVREIRSCAGRITQREIAERFRISEGTVSTVINRKVWAHVI